MCCSSRVVRSALSFVIFRLVIPVCCFVTVVCNCVLFVVVVCDEMFIVCCLFVRCSPCVVLGLLLLMLCVVCRLLCTAV